MAKFTEQSVSAAFQPYLNTGETLTNAAYCAYQSPLAFLLGPVGLALFTKVFIAGLTTRRVIILNLAKSVGGNINVLSFRTYDFDNLPTINATFGTFATELRITDPAAPFRANFPMAGVPSNYQRGQMIARELLTRRQNQGAMPASGQDVGQSTPTTETATAQLAQSPASSPPAQFAQQTSTAQYPVKQSSATVYGCLGAALIAFGSGGFLLAALVLIGMSLDSNKTTRDTIGGIIGGGTMILFAAAMIAVGVYVLRLRRSMKSRVTAPLSQALTPLTVGPASPAQDRAAAVDEGKTHGESLTLWARDEQTAQHLCNDQYFLLGVLMGDGSVAAQKIMDALKGGGALSYHVTPNQAQGGYNVKLALKSSGS